MTKDRRDHLRCLLLLLAVLSLGWVAVLWLYTCVDLREDFVDWHEAIEVLVYIITDWDLRDDLDREMAVIACLPAVVGVAALGARWLLGRRAHP